MSLDQFRLGKQTDPGERIVPELCNERRKARLKSVADLIRSHSRGVEAISLALFDARHCATDADRVIAADDLNRAR